MLHLISEDERGRAESHERFSKLTVDIGPWLEGGMTIQCLREVGICTVGILILLSATTGAVIRAGSVL
jgi:hypothetical protein